MTTYVKGKDLKVGQTIEVWWNNGRDTITKLEPYKGCMKKLWKDGAAIASFSYNPVGMTIDLGKTYKVFN